MNRKEAEKYIGKPVYLWTALHGTYSGILKTVDTPKGSPWRGNIEIKEVIEYPAIGLSPTRGGGILERKPFPEGFIANGGSASIKPLAETESIEDYKVSLDKALEKEIERTEKSLAWPYSDTGKGIMRKALKVLTERRGHSSQD